MGKNNYMRAIDIVARFIDSRPDGETYEAFSRRVGLPRTVSVNSLNRMKDIPTGLAFRIAKVFGYQIMFYNPKPPEGLHQIYVISEKKRPLKPRERKNHVQIKRDTYTGEVFRAVRKYKKQPKKYIKVNYDESKP